MTEYKYYHAGSFCIYYGQDSGRTVIMISERGKAFKGRSEGLGTAGGFVDAESKEQPRDAAVRELKEEVLKPDGTPILDTVTAARLRPVASGIDYGAGIPGTQYAGNSWHAHQCELTATEMTALKVHISRMQNDPDYAAAAREACGQETENVFLMTPQELVKGIESGKLKFAYSHEAQVVLTIAKGLLARAPKQCNDHGI